MSDRPSDRVIVHTTMQPDQALEVTRHEAGVLRGQGLLTNDEEES